MATEYGFFDSVAGDRTVDSADFATVHSALTVDGYVIGKDGEAQVTQTSPVTDDVQVSLGFVFVQGRWLRIFSAAETINVAAASATNPRIDRVCVRVDYSARTVTLAYLQGTPAATPSPPTLTQTAGVIWEHPLAQIFVRANATQIYTNQADAGGTQGYVIDERIPAVTGSQGFLGRFTRDADTTKIHVPVPGTGWRRLELKGRVNTDASTALTTGNIRFNSEDVTAVYSYQRVDTFGSAPSSHPGEIQIDTDRVGGVQWAPRHGEIRMSVENANGSWISGQINLVSRATVASGWALQRFGYGYENGPIRDVTLRVTTGPSWSTTSYVDLIGYV